MITLLVTLLALAVVLSWAFAVPFIEVGQEVKVSLWTFCFTLIAFGIAIGVVALLGWHP